MWATLHTRRGFTIVELIIVIVVISILVAVTIVTYAGIQQRAQFSAEQQDMTSIRKLLELYKVANGTYPNSAACDPSHYQYSWCGWGQGTANDFIPGLVPTFTSKIPNLPSTNAYTDTFLYQSRATGGNAGSGSDEYQLIRYNPAGLSAAEMTNNPNLMTTNGYNGIGWGFRTSDPANGWW